MTSKVSRLDTSLVIDADKSHDTLDPRTSNRAKIRILYTAHGKGLKLAEDSGLREDRSQSIRIHSRGAPIQRHHWDPRRYNPYAVGAFTA